MSENPRIILTPQQLKRLPGRGSKLSALRLRGMIEGLLVEAGIDSRAWVQKGDRTMLAFEVVDRSDGGDVEEFTDHLVMMLPDGREQTVREHIVESLAEGGPPALPFIRKEAPGR